MPKFSIITPVYNNKEYLPKCVDSILDQDFDDFEHIIVDDGSTDGTSELCDEIAKRDNRIRVIHQENQWIYASFNNGIKEASGEYIYIVNSDDTIVSNSLSQFNRIISEYNPDVIWTQVRACICNSQTDIIKTNIVGLAGSTIGGDCALLDSDMNREHWKELYYYGYSINQANLYKRDIAIRHPFRNDYYGADSLFNISIANDISKSYIMSEPIYNYYNYQKESMNASVGKVYGYEFEMFREILRGHSNLIRQWGGNIEDLLFFENLQVNTAINCIKLLNHPTLGYTTEQKIDKLLGQYFTPEFMNEVEDTDSFLAIDSEVTKELLYTTLKDGIIPDSKYYFIKNFFDMISNKNDISLEIVKDMIYNSLNPCHFGLSLCRKMGIV